MWRWGVGVGGSSNVPRNIDLDVARHVAVAMSHAADCLPTLRKVEDTSPFLATCFEHFVALYVTKRECQTPNFFAICLLQVPGNAACVFVRRRVRLKRRLEPVTLVLTKDVAENEGTVGPEVSFLPSPYHIPSACLCAYES